MSLRVYQDSENAPSHGLVAKGHQTKSYAQSRKPLGAISNGQAPSRKVIKKQRRSEGAEKVRLSPVIGAAATSELTRPL